MFINKFKGSLFLLIILLFENSNQTDPIVETSLGRIKGFSKRTFAGNEFEVFHNIPFAKSPTGNRRFMDPQPIKEWDTIIDGNRSPVQCSNMNIIKFLIDWNKDDTEYVGQEDCLYLSLYVPSKERRSGKSLPVMFFIHGGAFITGSGAMYEGNDFMDKDVILISINYRLGILGFLSTEDNIITGNFGLKDQAMALRWTKENIASFNGDPERITIFGESAGSASVHFHLVSPLSKGLFKRAILQSGTLTCPWAQSQDQKIIAHQVGASVDCIVSEFTGESKSKKLLECLQTVEPELLNRKLMNFLKWHINPINFGPYVDGRLITDDPWNLIKQGKHHNVDIITGITRDEGALFSAWALASNFLKDSLNSNFDYYGQLSLGLSFETNSEKITRMVYEYYLGDDFKLSETTADVFTKMLGDQQFNIHVDYFTRNYAEHVNRTGNKVFFYEYGHLSEHHFTPPGFCEKWVSHGDEMLMMFPMTDWLKDYKRNEQDEAMKNIFINLWTNFAAYGHPTPENSDLGYHWEPFTKENPRHLSLTLDPEMSDDNLGKVRTFWENIRKISKQSENEKTYKDEL